MEPEEKWWSLMEDMREIFRTTNKRFVLALAAQSDKLTVFECPTGQRDGRHYGHLSYPELTIKVAVHPSTIRLMEDE